MRFIEPGWSIPQSRRMRFNILYFKRGLLKTVHRSGFLTFRITNLIYRFWISCQALCLSKTAGRLFSSLLFNQIMAHDGIGFELFIYLCLDWQTLQEIFHWVFCLCRLKALKMVSCLDVMSCYLLRGIYSKTNRNRKLN